MPSEKSVVWMRPQLRVFFPVLLENAVSVTVACRHSKGRVSLIGGVGGQVLTQSHGLLQLGGNSWRGRTRQSVTWRETRQEVLSGSLSLWMMCTVNNCQAENGTFQLFLLLFYNYIIYSLTQRRGRRPWRWSWVRTGTLVMSSPIKTFFRRRHHVYNFYVLYHSQLDVF